MTFRVDQILTDVEVGAIAHGGHCVARPEGQVIFVRGALPGELVDVRVNEVRSRFARGEVVAVHRASADRIVPVCSIADRCGGCDFQHTTAEASRELKRAVVAELLGHLAGYEFTGTVEPVAPTPFGWRTRMRYRLDADRRPGLAGYRSNETVALGDQGCLLAVDSIARPAISTRPGGQILAVAAADEVVVRPVDGKARTVRQRVLDQDFLVSDDGFWQAHLGAPQALVEAVLDGLQPAPGEVAADLYCGVGLFAAFLAAAGCQVMGIEGERSAVELARRNVPAGSFLAGDVARVVARLPERLDLLVLDPPRSGAGAAVMAEALQRHPRAVAYVACDPAALGRDLKIAAGHGYQVESVRAFDLFPLTHHVECVAILKPS